MRSPSQQKSTWRITENGRRACQDKHRADVSQREDGDEITKIENLFYAILIALRELVKRQARVSGGADAKRFVEGKHDR